LRFQSAIKREKPHVFLCGRVKEKGDDGDEVLGFGFGERTMVTLTSNFVFLFFLLTFDVEWFDWFDRMICLNFIKFQKGCQGLFFHSQKIL